MIIYLYFYCNYLIILKKGKIKQLLSNFQAHFGKSTKQLEAELENGVAYKKRVPHNTTQHYILTVSKFLCLSIQGGPSRGPRLHRTPFSATIVKFKNG